MAVYDYRIGAGHNLPLGSLTNIEDIVPGSDVAFYPPESLGFYDPGQFRVRGDGSVMTAGFPKTEWRWRSITRAQVRHLQDTYCGGGYSGTVTIYTTTDAEDTYTRHNATMILPKLGESSKNFTRYTNYVVRMSRMVAL